MRFLALFGKEVLDGRLQKGTETPLRRLDILEVLFFQELGEVGLR